MNSLTKSHLGPIQRHLGPLRPQLLSHTLFLPQSLLKGLCWFPPNSYNGEKIIQGVPHTKNGSVALRYEWPDFWVFQYASHRFGLFLFFIFLGGEALIDSKNVIWALPGRCKLYSIDFSQQVAVWKTVIMILQKTPLKMFNATPSEKLLSN